MEESSASEIVPSPNSSTIEKPILPNVETATSNYTPLDVPSYTKDEIRGIVEQLRQESQASGKDPKYAQIERPLGTMDYDKKIVRLLEELESNLDQKSYKNRSLFSYIGTPFEVIPLLRRIRGGGLRINVDKQLENGKTQSTVQELLSIYPPEALEDVQVKVKKKKQTTGFRDIHAVYSDVDKTMTISKEDGKFTEAEVHTTIHESVHLMMNQLFKKNPTAWSEVMQDVLGLLRKDPRLLRAYWEPISLLHDKSFDPQNQPKTSFIETIKNIKDAGVQMPDPTLLLWEKLGMPYRYNDSVHPSIDEFLAELMADYIFHYQLGHSKEDMSIDFSKYPVFQERMQDIQALHTTFFQQINETWPET